VCLVVAAEWGRPEPTGLALSCRWEELLRADEVIRAIEARIANVTGVCRLPTAGVAASVLG
jgi:hypothetical protein